MRIFGRGASPTISVEPPQLLPGDELIATVTIPAALDKVAAATAELGYENTYAYRWAARADAAATSASTTRPGVRASRSRARSRSPRRVWYGPAFLDEQRRGLHDRLCRTRVVLAGRRAAEPATVAGEELWPATP